ncbi:toxin-antitoxin system YwqK family antitoxin [Alteromonas sp. KUL106]|uniref:toxin-antitoxin system YwqK family antitoxin n=1 Tax=Alteromonas sp. KUL106 TaxID=2480799 RepID=UPI00135BED7C|nr:toxin-antitoxin system YwqK family antitoxin [Alteromonas sp. KUL106]
MGITILGGVLIFASIFCVERLTLLSQNDVLVVPKSNITTSKRTGLKFYEQTLFTGHIVEYYPPQSVDGSLQLKSKSRYENGIKHGESKQWYPNGMLGFIAYYEKGKLHGPHISVWANGNLRAIAMYEKGKIQGLARQWYVSGEKFKRMNYIDGMEVGLQQAWRTNGKLYVNYENVNGRIFGMKKANLCFGLDNEELIL